MAKQIQGAEPIEHNFVTEPSLNSRNNLPGQRRTAEGVKTESEAVRKHKQFNPGKVLHL